MSEVRVNNIVDYGGKGAPTFDNGAVISGVSSLGNQAKIGSNVTITSGGINVSGVTTAATLSGNLTGDVNSGFVTATSAVIGSGVTINAGGLNITGVVTATTFEGDGSTMTGVAMTIAPLAYNPDVNDSVVATTSGIGITFDHRILAGSGNVTLSVATNAGVAGTVVENFGVGSSVTIAGRKAIIDPTSDLTNGETYHISYPSGAFTNTSGDTDYVGTAYTFGVKPQFISLWLWGSNDNGQLGQNNPVNTHLSSPTQVTGTNYSSVAPTWDTAHVIKTDGTFWGWGENSHGQMGQNSTTVGKYSSPVQIGSGTDWSKVFSCVYNGAAIKTDGSLWTMGYNAKGRSGQNNTTSYSSPVQVPGTWAMGTAGYNHIIATKTDGTLWAWGDGGYGVLAQGNQTEYSSPKQVPGTTWGTTYNTLSATAKTSWSIKTDGTLWGWGSNSYGGLGQNNRTDASSPKQVPGTDWKCISGCYESTLATKTDGTLWAWGHNRRGELGQNQGGTNNANKRSSPTQIPGTTWDIVRCGARYATATKTDGTLWAWGWNANFGQLGQNNVTEYSSPVQIPGTWSLANVDLGISYTSAGLQIT